MNTKLFSPRPLLLAGSLLIASTCGLLSTARADDASKMAVINEMFNVMHVDTLMQQSMQQGITAQRAQFDRLEPFKSNKAAADEIVTRMTALLTDKLSWDKIKPAMTKLYADNFTEEELTASLNFYKTPAGQAMLTKLPKVMGQSMTVVQQQMGDLTPEIRRIVTEVMAKYPASKSGASAE